MRHGDRGDSAAGPSLMQHQVAMAFEPHYSLCAGRATGRLIRANGFVGDLHNDIRHAPDPGRAPLRHLRASGRSGTQCNRSVPWPGKVFCPAGQRPAVRERDGLPTRCLSPMHPPGGSVHSGRSSTPAPRRGKIQTPMVIGWGHGRGAHRCPAAQPECISGWGRSMRLQRTVQRWIPGSRLNLGRTVITSPVTGWDPRGGTAASGSYSLSW